MRRGRFKTIPQFVETLIFPLANISQTNLWPLCVVRFMAPLLLHVSSYCLSTVVWTVVGRHEALRHVNSRMTTVIKLLLTW